MYRNKYQYIVLWKLYNRSRAEFENCLYFSLAKLNNLKRHGKDTNMDDNIKIPAAAFMTMVGGAGKIIVLKLVLKSQIIEMALKLFHCC